MSIRYQVFVSSTYADLTEERQSVIRTLMEMDCIPAGMELFPATDEDQFEFIKRVIDDSDYYLLIIGGRYGSLTEEGISYTEKEFDYAISKGIKVIALVHGEPNEIPFKKSEVDPELRDKLESFRKKVKTGRLIKIWNVASELPGLVSLSLNRTIKVHPAVGWIRANKVSSEQAMSEINELRKENMQLLAEVGRDGRKSTVEIPDLAPFNSSYKFGGAYRKKAIATQVQQKMSWTIEKSWESVFSDLSPYLEQRLKDSEVKEIVQNILFSHTDIKGIVNFITMNDQDFRTLTIQLKAYGLISTTLRDSKGNPSEYIWSLTPKGEDLMYRLRSVKLKT